MVAPLSLPIGYADRSVKVHPTVLYTICDAYIRRNEGQRRVIGALLGTTSDGVVEVKSCYAVPHSETNDQVLAPCRGCTCFGLLGGERMTGMGR